MQPPLRLDPVPTAGVPVTDDSIGGETDQCCGGGDFIHHSSYHVYRTSARNDVDSTYQLCMRVREYLYGVDPGFPDAPIPAPLTRKLAPTAALTDGNLMTAESADISNVAVPFAWQSDPEHSHVSAGNALEQDDSARHSQLMPFSNGWAFQPPFRDDDDDCIAFFMRILDAVSLFKTRRRVRAMWTSLAWPSFGSIKELHIPLRKVLLRHEQQHMPEVEHLSLIHI